ncbi:MULTISPECIES: DUF364 domain-containing protein [Anaerolinea]|jgi:uncharacterized protein (DUF4213/DUF364 family)|uniref:DUF364 domain-containing protein n=1 Tax=Anaerolinea TaxID=233189 RepID=UPI0026215593|nr:DUF364 domain-containing protein [Anaerolinea thermophila]
MEIFDRLIETVSDARVIGVEVGLFWTMVMIEQEGKVKSGLAATLTNPEWEHARYPAVEEAGRLENRSALELAHLVYSQSYTETGIGLATINALLPPVHHFVDLPAEEYIIRHGKDKKVALIGHFPFVSQLKNQVKELWVLELHPQGEDLPASMAPEIIPQADILAITATTLINHTFESVFNLRKQGAKVLLLGPSTPLSPLLFDFGIDVLSGSLVENSERILPLIRQGATFRQIRPNGVRLVTIES